MKVYWTYENDHILLDNNLNLDEIQKLLPGKRIRARLGYLGSLKITKDKLDKERQVIIDIYPDFNIDQIAIHLGKPMQYIRSRVRELKSSNNIRPTKLLDDIKIDHIKMSSKDKKAVVIAREMDLPLNLVRVAISDRYREERAESAQAKRIEKKKEQALNKMTISEKIYKLDGIYEIKDQTSKKSKKVFKGKLVYQDSDFVLMKHQNGYKECFLKSDLLSGEYSIKEIS